jgi:hypothetical protein
MMGIIEISLLIVTGVALAVVAVLAA